MVWVDQSTAQLESVSLENAQMFGAYAIGLKGVWDRYSNMFEGQVMCIGDEKTIEPFGGICISLQGLNVEGRTHRLTNEQW